MSCIDCDGIELPVGATGPAGPPGPPGPAGTPGSLYTFISPNGTVQIVENIISSTLTEIQLQADRFYRVIWLDAIHGNDATAEKYNFMLPYQTLDTALSVANSGDLLIIHPGGYSCNHPDGLSVSHNFSIYAHPGVQISGNPVFRGMKNNFRMYGHASIVSLGTEEWSNSIAFGSIVELDSYISYGGFSMNDGGYLRLTVNKDIEVPFFSAATMGIKFDRINVNGFVHDVIIKADKIQMLQSTPTSHGIQFLNPYPGSKIYIEADIITVAGLVNNNTILCVGDELGRMGYEVVIKSRHIVSPGDATSHAIKVSNNAIWGGGTVYGGEAGIYIYGTVLHGLSTTNAAIGVYGGKIKVIGNVHGVTGGLAVSMTEVSDIGNFNSEIILEDGYGAGGSFIRYADVNCMAQLKNYKINVLDPGGYLVDSAVPACSYQLLSAYSNRPVNVANVTNSIAGTTLVEDAAIIYP